MANNAPTLAIIPARQGSKRLLGKNMLPLVGKPLIQWSIEAAQKSRAVDEVLVTSDDPSVLALARQLGVDHVLERPRALASDTAKTSDVILHALEYRTRLDDSLGAICLLQATSPLRTAKDIDAAYDFYETRNALSVISVCELEHPLAWCSTLDKNLFMKGFVDKICHDKRSQDHEKSYRLNGAVYIASASFFMERGSFLTNETLAYVMPKSRSIDIDDEFDFRLTEAILKDREMQR
ncbi:acylneuraminate cytidylyltransferase family protein [Salinicola salarius]|uniref:acylneuraminate cytidylyltransferase family protein n=1 Tax=Salinicola salarius TaxID=430457 RepID=UPI0023E44ECD|nr:acylneuraminate cytidylyltransferase family protein [Salinicola salarius]MDF3917320.1 acylneuraminate cytidylyltransferase family protein [Salinicola salarius]